MHTRPSRPGRYHPAAMLDLLYLAITVAFFALMLAFVRGLEILGRGATGEDHES